MVRGCLPLLYLPFPIRHAVRDQSCRGRIAYALNTSTQISGRIRAYAIRPYIDVSPSRWICNPHHQQMAPDCKSGMTEQR